MFGLRSRSFFLAAFFVFLFCGCDACNGDDVLGDSVDCDSVCNSACGQYTSQAASCISCCTAAKEPQKQCSCVNSCKSSSSQAAVGGVKGKPSQTSGGNAGLSGRKILVP
jgi:hypothetical protein